MSRATKLTIGAALEKHVMEYCEREGLTNFTDGQRRLMVLGLAADWHMRNLSGMGNPFLRPAEELLKP